MMNPSWLLKTVLKLPFPTPICTCPSTYMSRLEVDTSIFLNCSLLYFLDRVGLSLNLKLTRVARQASEPPESTASASKLWGHSDTMPGLCWCFKSGCQKIWTWVLTLYGKGFSWLSHCLPLFLQVKKKSASYLNSPACRLRASGGPLQVAAFWHWEAWLVSFCTLKYLLKKLKFIS